MTGVSVMAVTCRRFGKFGYRLFSTSCEGCDAKLGKYSCDTSRASTSSRFLMSPRSVSAGPAASSPAKDPFVSECASFPCCVRCVYGCEHGAVYGCEGPCDDACVWFAVVGVAQVLKQRQVLLELTQSVLFLDRAGVNARRMEVLIPSITLDGSREVWCPRHPRGCGNSSRVSKSGASVRRSSASSPVPAAEDGSFEANSFEGSALDKSMSSVSTEASVASRSQTPSPSPSPEPRPQSPAEASGEPVTLANRLPKWNDGECAMCDVQCAMCVLRWCECGDAMCV